MDVWTRQAQARVAMLAIAALFFVGVAVCYGLDGDRVTHEELDGAQQAAGWMIAASVVLLGVVIVVSGAVMNALAGGGDDDDVPPGIY